MANVYKSTTYKAIDSRPIEAADETKTNTINSTINSFFTYFKSKHLS